MTAAPRLFAASVLSLTLIAVALPAEAQAEQGCKADVEKFCASVEKGQGRVMKCLHDHTDELSDDCKKSLEEARARRAAHRQQGRAGGPLRRACNEDIEKYCKSAVGKRQELAACLNEHKSDLSAPCKERVEQVMKRIQERSAAKATP